MNLLADAPDDISKTLQLYLRGTQPACYCSIKHEGINFILCHHHTLYDLVISYESAKNAPNVQSLLRASHIRRPLEEALAYLEIPLDEVEIYIPYHA